MTDAVQNATQVIDTRMSSGFLNPITHDDVRAVTDAISALPAADADRLVDQLAGSGKLDRIAEEAMDGSILGLGGLSTDERQAFFADMAGKLDGQSLATLSNAFAKTGGDAHGYTPVTELGSAIATHAAPQAKVDYIAQIAPGAESGSHSDIGFGISSVNMVDAEARAAGEVLGSLRGSFAESGFQALGTHLPDVLTSAIDGDMTTVAGYGGSATTVSWNAENYEAIMGAAASMGNADLKAHVFDAGIDTLRSVRDTDTMIGGLTVVGKDDALRTMTDGLTAVVDSDTTGVMRELTMNGTTRDGSDFSAYAKEMLNQGREAELGTQMGRLQVGNSGNENAVERLYRSEVVPNTEHQTRLPNAAALGYFVGSVSAAVKSIDGDVADQRATTTAMLKSALTVVDKARIGGPAAAAVGTTASVAKEWVQFAVNSAITNPNADAAVTLARAALPIDASTGETGVGSAVMSDFEDTLSFVSQYARP
ncbi:hypothetical protein ABVV53_10160 [Novosphingobium sp. RD2P27]|uniref:Uncharacterized protein n=1 Tax=Novosphingobium kalidii TaxID=3230299 RepID=A0ABV2D1W9_9SPHN